MAIKKKTLTIVLAAAAGTAVIGGSCGLALALTHRGGGDTPSSVLSSASAASVTELAVREDSLKRESSDIVLTSEAEGIASVSSFELKEGESEAEGATCSLSSGTVSFAVPKKAQGQRTYLLSYIAGTDTDGNAFSCSPGLSVSCTPESFFCASDAGARSSCSEIRFSVYDPMGLSYDSVSYRITRDGTDYDRMLTLDEPCDDLSASYSVPNIADSAGYYDGDTSFSFVSAGGWEADANETAVSEDYISPSHVYLSASQSGACSGHPYDSPEAALEIACRTGWQPASALLGNGTSVSLNPSEKSSESLKTVYSCTVPLSSWYHGFALSGEERSGTPAVSRIVFSGGSGETYEAAAGLSLKATVLADSAVFDGTSSSLTTDPLTLKQTLTAVYSVPTAFTSAEPSDGLSECALAGGRLTVRRTYEEAEPERGCAGFTLSFERDGEAYSITGGAGQTLTDSGYASLIPSSAEAEFEDGTETWRAGTSSRVGFALTASDGTAVKALPGAAEAEVLIDGTSYGCQAECEDGLFYLKSDGLPSECLKDGCFGTTGQLRQSFSLVLKTGYGTTVEKEFSLGLYNPFAEASCFGSCSVGTYLEDGDGRSGTECLILGGSDTSQTAGCYGYGSDGGILCGKADEGRKIMVKTEDGLGTALGEAWLPYWLGSDANVYVSLDGISRGSTFVLERADLVSDGVLRTSVPCGNRVVSIA